MIIKGRGGVELAVFVTDAGVTSPEVTLVIHRPGEVEPVAISLNPNHCQGLELVLTGARLEAEARGRGE